MISSAEISLTVDPAKLSICARLRSQGGDTQGSVSVRARDHKEKAAGRKKVGKHPRSLVEKKRWQGLRCIAFMHEI